VQWVVEITLDHGEFEKLTVIDTATDKQIFAHSR
jgi:hypothetical protein